MLFQLRATSQSKKQRSLDVYHTVTCVIESKCTSYLKYDFMKFKGKHWQLSLRTRIRHHFKITSLVLTGERTVSQVILIFVKEIFVSKFRARRRHFEGIAQHSYKISFFMTTSQQYQLGENLKLSLPFISCFYPHKLP